MTEHWTRGWVPMVMDDGAGHALLADFDDVEDLVVLQTPIRAVQERERLPVIHVRESPAGTQYASWEGVCPRG